MFLKIFTFIFYLITIYTACIYAIEVHKLNDVFEILHHSCFIGFFTESKTNNSHIVENVYDIFRNDKNVTIGYFHTPTHSKWPNGQTFKINSFQNQIIALERIVLDRSCLLFPSHLSASPEFVNFTKPINLENLVQFINKLCKTFRNVDGNLNDKGLRRRKILDNLYKVKGANMNDLFSKAKNSLDKHFIDAQQIMDESNDTVEMAQCDTFDISPSPETFFNEFLTRSRPVIFKNLINHWPALVSWSNDKMRKLIGNKTVHIKLTPNGDFEGVENASLWKDYHTFKIPENVTRHLPFIDLVVVRPAGMNMKMMEFLDLIEKTGTINSEDGRNISAYMEYSSVADYMPDLLNDIKEPEFAKKFLSRKHINSWLSDGHTIGRIHFDEFDNLLCQISGVKQAILFEPWQNENLYESHIVQGVLKLDENKLSDGEFIFKRNNRQDMTSMVMSPVNVKKPDFVKFKKLTKAKPLNCTISGGDVLYIPAFWWHEVNSKPNVTERRNLAVNYWYSPFLQKEFPCQDCPFDVNPKYFHLL